MTAPRQMGAGRACLALLIYALVGMVLPSGLIGLGLHFFTAMKLTLAMSVGFMGWMVLLWFGLWLRDSLASRKAKANPQEAQWRMEGREERYPEK